MEEDGVWEPIAVRRGLHRSHRAWLLAGGPKAVEREAGRERDIEVTRQARGDCNADSGAGPASLRGA